MPLTGLARSLIQLNAAPETGSSTFTPFQQHQEESGSTPNDFFLFIKDYGWTLRYRVSRIAEQVKNATEQVLDMNKPLQLEWVKLRRPLSSPAELFSTSSEDLFEWETVEPPRHQGFMYHVTRAIGSGVEAVINFFEGHGLKLLVRADTGIQLMEEGSDADIASEDVQAQPVTHCWVQVRGMSFLPMLQSIAFYNLQQVVTDWQA